MKLMNLGVLQETETEGTITSQSTHTCCNTRAVTLYNKPFLGLFESRWRVSWDQEEGSHWVHTAESCVCGGRGGRSANREYVRSDGVQVCLTGFSFCDLNGSDAQGPLVTLRGHERDGQLQNTHSKDSHTRMSTMLHTNQQ